MLGKERGCCTSTVCHPGICPRCVAWARLERRCRPPYERARKAEPNAAAGTSTVTLIPMADFYCQSVVSFALSAMHSDQSGRCAATCLEKHMSGSSEVL